MSSEEPIKDTIENNNKESENEQSGSTTNQIRAMLLNASKNMALSLGVYFSFFFPSPIPSGLVLRYDDISLFFF